MNIRVVERGSVFSFLFVCLIVCFFDCLLNFLTPKFQDEYSCCGKGECGPTERGLFVTGPLDSLLAPLPPLYYLFIATLFYLHPFLAPSLSFLSLYCTGFTLPSGFFVCSLSRDSMGCLC